MDFITSVKTHLVITIGEREKERKTNEFYTFIRYA